MNDNTKRLPDDYRIKYHPWWYTKLMSRLFGRRVTVCSSNEFHAALKNAKKWDTIEVTRGTVLTGGFTTRPGRYLTIRSKPSAGNER